MALSTTTLQLQHVVDEIAGTQTSLQDCVDDAITAGFNSTYYTAPATSLAEFRGYETPVSEPTCSISLCEDDEPGYLSGTSCSVTSGSETVSFSFTPYDITGPRAITGVVTVSGSQSASESLSFRDGFEISSTITLPNNVQYGEYYFITICSVIPM